MKTLMAKPTFDFDIPRQLRVLENWKADFSLRHTPSIHTQTLHQDLGCNTPGKQVTLI